MRATLVVLGILLAKTAYVLSIRKKVTLENLRNAYPDLSQREIETIAKKAFRNLGIVFAEMLYLRFAGRRAIASHTKVSNPELFDKALSQGNGLIVIAGHFANWEWLALGGALILKKNFAVVRKNIQTSFTERFLEKMRIRTGNTLVNSADIRKMYRILGSGGCIALLADQAAPGESTRVPFFGRDVPTFEGPARLALRTRAPILFAECLRAERGEYHISFQEIPFEDLQGDSPENIHELTLRHTKLLESIIRKHPDQWLWQHRRWKYI
ncbi:MAG: lysophospholipid acyltransferase family protein [Bacteroidota bacterium]|nr:lysophospholipid acyltransferase family protein [Bacteroidota bacterium]